MDKSFNDQELSDIMKEIEALEEEFTEEATSKIEASPVMEELAELAEEKAIPATNLSETVLPFQPKAKAPEKATAPATSMMFKVQGSMNLELQFDIGGKTVMLEVTEAGLNIQMEGGVTFNVPVSESLSVKKAV